MKICFWGNIARALTGKTDGGGELQLALLAKALARIGHEVVIIDPTLTKGFISEDGIKVIEIKGWNSGIRFIRAFTNHVPKLYLSLKAQKADIYYCRILDFRHIVAFWAARKVKAKFVLGIASDIDVMNLTMRFKYSYRVNYKGIWTFISAILIELTYPILFRNADLVMVQHEGQKNILLKKNIKSVVFPNLFDNFQYSYIKVHSNETFVYVGSLNIGKGLNEFIELVMKAPLHTFKVIGQPEGKKASLGYEKLKSFCNVTLYGRLSHSDTLNHISNSKALISTSHMEGFPNVFIEAWACGVPVLSLFVDPGDIIKREKLGEVAEGNIEKMLQAMDKIINTDEFAQKARAYVEHYHTLNADKIKEISCLFNEIYNH